MPELINCKPPKKSIDATISVNPGATFFKISLTYTEYIPYKKERVAKKIPIYTEKYNGVVEKEVIPLIPITKDFKKLYCGLPANLLSAL